MCSLITRAMPISFFGLSGRDQAQNVHLTHRQTARRLLRFGVRHEGVHPGEIGESAELLKHPSGRVELHRGR